MSSKGFYITTAIAYPNSRMHVGFGWEVIGSDMVARFQRMRGREVFFSTGTDEHSQNVEKAAVKAGQTPKAYCDEMADSIKESMRKMEISYDRFIRTSDADHEVVSRYLLEKAFKAGDVYKQKYEGLYCDSCEVFYTEKETVQGAKGPECVTHKAPLRRLAEENYFFRLSKYRDFLRAELSKKHADGHYLLEPENRRNEILSFLDQELKDFSVSRTTFKWGIPIPFDPGHIIYVWYDALINYLTAVKFPAPGNSNGDESFFKKFWPADVHVIGKDITRFHTVYWPAMLKSAGVDLPMRVWAHGFINLNGEKMSKTRGNIVTPDEVIADFGATALRWYMLAANPFSGDGNYSDQDIVLKCNADLSNNIGNLVNRTINMSRKYFGDRPLKDLGELPAGVTPVGPRFDECFGANASKMSDAVDKMELADYCARAVQFSMALNKFIDETKPWALGKVVGKEGGRNTPEAKQLETVLAQCLEGVRNLGFILYPVIPSAAVAILKQLGVEASKPQWSAIGFAPHPLTLQEPQPLFPRLEAPKEEPKA